MGDASKILGATGLKSEMELNEGLRRCVQYARAH
jgi:hypothetical protein